MKKALLLVAFMAIAFLSACEEEDNGVGPTCPWEVASKPDFRKVIDHYLGTIWAETKHSGNEDGSLTLYFAAKEDRYCKLVPDYNVMYQDDSTYAYLTFLVDGRLVRKVNRPFWTQYDNLLQFGGYVYHTEKYRANATKGYVEFTFLLQDTVTNVIYRISDKIRYEVKY